MYLEGPEIKDFIGFFSDDEDLSAPSDILTWTSFGIFSRTFSPEELEGETLYSLSLSHSADFLSARPDSSFYFLDTENNRLSFLASVHLKYSTLPNGELTMVLEGVGYKLNGEYHKLTDELIVLSWPITPQGEFYEKDLTNKAGDKVGNIRLAPFSLDLSLSEPSVFSIEEVPESICLMKKNGAYVPISHLASSSSSSGGGTYDFSLEFRKPMLLDDMASLLLGDYKADLRD